MACNGSSCQQSGCYRNGDELAAPGDCGAAAAPSRGNGNDSLCAKCKVNKPFSSGASGGGGDDGRLCAECFRSNLFGKFRQAVISNAMIGPTDNVLVAFSGGPASRVSLQFVHELQYKAQKNFDASSRSLPVFGVGVAFIDESAAYTTSSDKAMDRAIEDIKSIVSELSLPTKNLHLFPIERLYSGDSGDQREKLKGALDAVTDATGKEDFLVHLRMLALQKIASENGYSRVVLGSCTSRIASHVITTIVKGRGYSLPADIQYVDARWEVPVVLPLRDCLTQELNILCHLDSLKTVRLPYEPCSTINSLVSSFVALLQEENPSRESTIVRTAGKLTPFAFNRIPEINDTNVPLATRRRQKRSSLKLNGSISSESFCPMCYSPLMQSKSPATSTAETHKSSSDFFGTSCCSSCQFQILPQDPSRMEHLHSHLPTPLVARAAGRKPLDFSSVSILVGIGCAEVHTLPLVYLQGANTGFLAFR